MLISPVWSTSAISDSGCKRRAGFLHCQSHQLVRRLHGGHRHNFVADGDVSGLGAFGQHRIDRRNGDVGRTDRLNIKAGEDVLPQRVEDTGNNARNVENFPCNLADHDVGVIVLGDSSDGVTTLDACLPQNGPGRWAHPGW